MVITLMTLCCHDAKQRELNKSYTSAPKSGYVRGRGQMERKKQVKITFKVSKLSNSSVRIDSETQYPYTAKSLQLCPSLCDPIDGSPPGSPVPGILQARTLEWVAISFSNAWKWKVKVKLLSHLQLLATPWTAAHQAPPSMGFSRQEYWSGMPLPSLIPTLNWPKLP